MDITNADGPPHEAGYLARLERDNLNLRADVERFRRLTLLQGEEIERLREERAVRLTRAEFMAVDLGESGA